MSDHMHPIPRDQKLKIMKQYFKQYYETCDGLCGTCELGARPRRTGHEQYTYCDTLLKLTYGGTNETSN